MADAGRAVDLLQEFVVNQDAAVFGGDQVGPSACRQADLEAAATHVGRDLCDGFVFSDFAVFELGDPDLFHALVFEELDVFFTEQMTFGEEFLAAGPEDGATKDSSGRFPHIDGLRFHGEPPGSAYEVGEI